MNEFFLDGTPGNLVGFGAALAVSSGILAVAFEIGLRAVSTSSMPGVAVQFDANLLTVIAVIRYLLVVSSIVLPLMLILCSVLRNRGPRVLAIHATTDGVTLWRSDGASEYRTWNSIVNSESRAGRWMWGLAWLFRRGEPWDVAFRGHRRNVVRRAAQRTFGRPARRVPVDVRMRLAFWKSIPFVLFCVAFCGWVTMLAILFPGAPTPRHSPPSPELVLVVDSFLALLSSALPGLLIFQYFGWHRAELRWRQVWRTRPRPPRSVWDSK